MRPYGTGPGWVGRAINSGAAAAPYRGSNMAMRAALRQGRRDEARRTAVCDRIAAAGIEGVTGDLLTLPPPELDAQQVESEAQDAAVNGEESRVGISGRGMVPYAGSRADVIHRLYGPGGAVERAAAAAASTSTAATAAADAAAAAAVRPSTACSAARDDYFAAAAAAVSWPGEELDAFDAPYSEDCTEHDSSGDGWHPPHANPPPGLAGAMASMGLGPRIRQPSETAAEEAAEAAVAAAAASAGSRIEPSQRLRPGTAPPIRSWMISGSGVHSFTFFSST